MTDRYKNELLLRQRQALADFGDFSLQSEDLDEVLSEACRIVAEVTGTGRAKVLAIEPGGETLFVRAGVGWGEGVVGRVRIRMEDWSSESYAIRLGEPVIMQDLRSEDRFGVPPFMTEAGVMALVNVPIFLPRGRAFGLLQVDDTRPRRFDNDDVQFLRTYAAILGPVIDRVFKLQDLRSSETRYRAIVETATDYGIFTTDPRGRVETWPPGAESVYGWPAEEAIGRMMDITFTAEDRAAGVPQQERLAAATDGHAADVRWHLRSDGSGVFIEGVTRPLRDTTGAVTGFVKVGQDVTRRRATESALRESDERFRQFGEASADVLWIRDAETLAYEYLSPAYETIYGASRAEALGEDHLDGWVSAVHPEDRARAGELLQRVRDGHVVQGSYRIVRKSDGEVRWVRNSDFPLFGAEGRVQRIGGITHDATEEIETRERLVVLVNELQHRTRNLIGVVSSIANQTMAETGPTEAFRVEFSTRLAALSRVQGLLSRANEEPVSIDMLLRLELDALGAPLGDRVRLEGPFVRIRPAIVQTLALVIHELATNARKYGALSAVGGDLSVRWDLQRSGGERRAFIEWREDGITLPSGAAESRAGGGYGRRLIEQALPHSLKARTTYELRPGLLRCTIDLPLDPATRREGSE